MPQCDVTSTTATNKFSFQAPLASRLYRLVEEIESDAIRPFALSVGDVDLARRGVVLAGGATMTTFNRRCSLVAQRQLATAAAASI